MQVTEIKVKKIMFLLILLIILGTVLLEYAFNITFFRQLIILTIGGILISVFTYFYFRPSFVMERRREIFLLLFSLLIFFIFMEIVLRVTACGWKWDVNPNDEIKYKYEKSTKICNSIMDGKRFYFMTNNEGFIDDDFKFSEKDYNIFLVGDSSAACLESDYVNCAHKKLERDLKMKYGDKINIMNFGVSSYSGLAELAVIKKYVEVYKPKMIILYFNLNDIGENRDYSNKIYLKNKFQKLIRAITPKTFLFLFTHGKNFLDNVLIDSKWYRNVSGLEMIAFQGRQVYAKEYNSEWQDLLKIELNVLDEIYNISEKENITILHVAVTGPEQVYEERWTRAYETYPSLNPEDYIASKPNDIIMSYAEKKGIPHLDLLPLFRENNKTSLHWIEGHWNDKGQLLAAEKIEEYIVKNNLIKVV